MSQEDTGIELVESIPGAWWGDLYYSQWGIEVDTTFGAQIYYADEDTIKGWVYHATGTVGYGNYQIGECEGVPIAGDLHLGSEGVYYSDCINISNPAGLCVQLYFEEELVVDFKFITLGLTSVALDNYRDLNDIYMGDIGFNDTLHFWCIY